MNKRIDLVLSMECNQRCTFCFNHAIKKRYDKEKFSLNNLKMTLEKGVKEGITSVSISGGEPTISKDFFQVLNLASRLGYKDIRVITNGMMFYYDAFAKKASKMGINQICVSLHGNSPEIHDKFTKVKGSFEKVIKGIKNIKKYFKNIQLTAHVVLTKETTSILEEHTRFLIDLGFDAVNFLYLMANSELNSKLAPNSTLVKEKLEKVIEQYKDDIYIHIGYLEPCLLPGYEKYFDTNDFDMEFISNCNELFEDWKQTLLDNKSMTEECHNCKFSNICMGHWIKNINS
ncbi:MAG: radical SAM protein [Nanoarchaeota archaeon]|nr:radical SAM protein [Nanoarchaeota archaeon]MCK5629429.1 radical SAM protein [Nanoarchaeota archaeon]